MRWLGGTSTLLPSLWARPRVPPDLCLYTSTILSNKYVAVRTGKERWSLASLHCPRPSWFRCHRACVHALRVYVRDRMCMLSMYHLLTRTSRPRAVVCYRKN